MKINGRCKFDHVDYNQPDVLQNYRPRQANPPVAAQPIENRQRGRRPQGGAGDIGQQQPRMFAKKCKFGAACHQKRMGKCTYIHDVNEDNGDQEIIQPQELNMMGANRHQVQQERRPQGNRDARPNNGGMQANRHGDRLKNDHPHAIQELPQRRMMQNAPQLHQQQQKKPSYTYSVLNQLISMPLNELKADLVAGDFKKKLDGTAAEKDIPALVLVIVLSLIKDRDESDIRTKLLSQFLESDFIRSLRTFIELGASQLVRNFVEYENKFDFLLLANEVFAPLLDMFPSKRDAIPVISLCFSVEELVNSQFISGKSSLELERMPKNPNKLVEMSAKLKNAFLQSAKKVEVEEQKRAPKEESKLLFQIADDQSYKDQPREDFTLIDPIPGEFQLTDDDSSQIRRMPETGNLVSNNNYLDLLFRLLYEDAVSDLRGGVQLMKRLGKQLQNNKKLTRKEILLRARQANVKLHEEVTIQGVEAVEGAACVAFRIQTNKNRFVDWKISKKLLPGSLVLLSSDNFTSIFVGIIKQRDAVVMNKTHKKYGFVPINIEVVKFINIASPPESVLEITERYSTKAFTMIESSAYFESYVHVLRSLQQMNKWSALPFSTNIVNGDSTMYMPIYIELEAAQREKEIKDFIKGIALDPSQSAAMQNALTMELALIQGPPGTGKTYIGVQIVKYLLQNKHQWNQTGPILLVTYTNHALNQFITHVSQYTHQIVRVGGRVDDEILKKFGLRELLFQSGKRQQYGKLRREIEDAKREIQAIQKDFSTYQLGYIHTQIANYQKSYLDEEENDEYTLGESISQIFQMLKKHFAAYLKHALQQFREEPDFIDYVEEKIKKLKEQTNNNILFIFWLGIIDLESLIVQVYEKQYLAGVALDEEKKKEEDEDELDENDMDFLDERDKDYLNLKKIAKLSFNEALESAHKAIQDAFSQETCCHRLNGKVESFSEAISFMNEHNWGAMTGPQINEALIQATSRDTFKAMPIEVRWSLNNYILTVLKQKSEISMGILVKQFSEAQKRMGDLDQLNAENIFKTADIVAMTTTGRSKYSEFFKNVTFPIVIVEEAAEVFEAHIITALSKSTQHLILIGDHLQLRPNPAVYHLSHNYNLSLSMFERLINNKVPHSTLAQQRRMRPEISKMMNLIYPDLKNHDTVLQYPQIKGVSSSLYFYDHKFKESSNDLMMSKVNKDEAEIVVRFAVYLLQNRYAPDKITILTLYAGQLLHIKQIVKNYKVLPDQLKRIKVINVDNYQGEENDIILLSLVRSNPENKIGFLKISNRVCVALSRARMGLFIFGNSKCLLGSEHKLWEDVVSYLKENAFFGDALKFQCAFHKIATEVKTVEDFHKIPEGGCMRPCEARMDCGHSCTSICHPYEQSGLDPTGHQKMVCHKPCSRPRVCGHDCTYECADCKFNHQPCLKQIPILMPVCGHSLTIQCRQNTRDFTCTAPCEKTLACGHQCKMYCGQICNLRPCKENVEKTLICGHKVEQRCNEKHLSPKCYKSCDHKLPCGHGCLGNCGECSEKGHHQLCNKNCPKYLVCGHNCKDKCTLVCSPCQSTCYTKCRHSQCKSKCGEVCILCKEPCENKCEHTRCTKLCSEPCNMAPCNQSCEKKLACGHPCIGLCGEKCPKVCRVCKPGDEAFSILFGFEKDPDVHFIELDCGHVFEVYGLDRYMQQDFTVIKYRECPKCKQPVNKCGRYMKYINQTLNDINTVKRIIQENNSQINLKLTAVKRYLAEETAKYGAYLPGSTTSVGRHIGQIVKLLALQFQIYEKQKSVKDLNTLIEDAEYQFSLHQINSLYYTMSIRLGVAESLQKNFEIIAKQVEDVLNKKQVEEFHRSQAKMMITYLRKAYPVEMSKDSFPIAKLQIEDTSNDWHKCPNMHYFTSVKLEGAANLFDEVNHVCPQCGAKYQQNAPPLKAQKDQEKFKQLIHAVM